MSEFVGRVLGPYKLEQQLGKGGMATVYRAFQTTVKRYVAVKVMSPEIARDPGFVERFTREAELIAALQHPHILPVIDYGESDGVHYLVMRYIDSGSLDDMMRKKQLSFEDTSRMLAQMSSALDYAHKKGVIHRDFKPNNVLLDAEENCYLTDFGIARLQNSERNLTMTGAIMGTPAYMSPEQGMGKTVDARADLYSLGVVLYEMVVGRLPFTGDTPASLIFQHAFQPPAPPQQYRPDVPVAVISVITRALAKEPDDRYQSGVELSRAFDEAIGRRSATPPAGVQLDAKDLENLNTFVGDRPSSSARRASTPQPFNPEERTIPPTGVRGLSAPSTIPPVPEPAPRSAAAAALRAASPPPSGPQPPATGAGTTSARPAGNRSSLPLLFGAVAAVALILGVGGALVVNSNNQNATNEAFTRVAVIALSATKTPTLTPTLTETPTITLTPSNTPTLTLTPTLTPSLTPTVDVAGTAFSIRLTQLAEFEAAGTATALANLNATATQQANVIATGFALVTNAARLHATETAASNAIALALTQVLIDTATAAAQFDIQTATAQARGAARTGTALFEATSDAATNTADAANSQATRTAGAPATAAQRTLVAGRTATARAIRTATARSAPSATFRATVTRTTAPVNSATGPYTGAPEDVIAALGSAGILRTTSGSAQVGPLTGAIDPIDQKNYYRWRALGTYEFTDFVASATFTWKDMGSDGECGFLARYSQPTTSTFRFHVFSTSIAGNFRVITYKDTADKIIQRGNVAKLNQDNGATNHILLIGQGTRYRFFVNGVLATDVNLADFASGNIAVLGATLNDTGITCNFTNAWVYELKAGVSASSTPKSSGSKGDLLSNEPAEIVQALVTQGVIPTLPELTYQEASQTLASKKGDKKVFFRTEVAGSAAVRAFVMSTDITWNHNADDTLCGVHFYGTRGPSNLMAFSYYPGGNYFLEAYVQDEWQKDPLAKGSSTAFNGEDGDTNRVIVVAYNNTATIFVNGTQVVKSITLPLSRGNVGYFLSVGEATEIEACEFDNTYVWTVK